MRSRVGSRTRNAGRFSRQVKVTLIYTKCLCSFHWPLMVVSWNVKHWRNCSIKTRSQKQGVLVKATCWGLLSCCHLSSSLFRKTPKNHWSGCFHQKLFYFLASSSNCLFIIKPPPTKILCQKMTGFMDDHTPCSLLVPHVVTCCLLQIKKPKAPWAQRELGLRSRKVRKKGRKKTHSLFRIPWGICVCICFFKRFLMVFHFEKMKAVSLRFKQSKPIQMLSWAIVFEG